MVHEVMDAGIGPEALHTVVFRVIVADRVGVDEVPGAVRGPCGDGRGDGGPAGGVIGGGTGGVIGGIAGAAIGNNEDKKDARRGY